jgi:hypothetical protein
VPNLANSLIKKRKTLCFSQKFTGYFIYPFYTHSLPILNLCIFGIFREEYNCGVKLLSVIRMWIQSTVLTTALRVHAERSIGECSFLKASDSRVTL